MATWSKSAEAARHRLPKLASIRRRYERLVYHPWEPEPPELDVELPRQDRPAAGRHGAPTGCGCEVAACRRLLPGTALDIMTPGAGARDSGMVSPCAYRLPSLRGPVVVHGGARRPARPEAIMKTTRRLRTGSLLLVAVGVAASAPGCGGDSRRDGTLAPVLESDRAGLEKSRSTTSRIT